MITKKITYTDYEGQERTEEFMFNLTQAELAVMNLSATGGLEKIVKKMIDTQDIKKLIELLDEIVMKSYGIKSDDGRRFIKSPELSEEFKQTEAYSELFMELLNDAGAAAAFINGAVPANLAAKAAELQAEQKVAPIAAPLPDRTGQNNVQNLRGSAKPPHQG